MSGHHINAHAALVATRLLMTVLALVVVAWAAAAALAWQETDDEVSDLLDAHLAQTAALLRLQPLDELDEDRLNGRPNWTSTSPAWCSSCGMRAAAGPISQCAARAPDTRQHKRGFADSTVDGKAWRVFVTQGRESDVRILVGELQSVREEIILASLTSILAAGLEIGLCWHWASGGPCVARCARWSSWAAQWPPASPNRWNRLPQGVPPEVLPLVTALNDLFERTARLLATEQQFTADAAHELRTPIAGIRMQAQVAQGAADSQERARALEATVQGCDRATRLVEQLLQLARLDAEPATGNAQSTPLADVIRSWWRNAARPHSAGSRKWQSPSLCPQPSIFRCPSPWPVCCCAICWTTPCATAPMARRCDCRWPRPRALRVDRGRQWPRPGTGTTGKAGRKVLSRAGHRPDGQRPGMVHRAAHRAHSPAADQHRHQPRAGGMRVKVRW